MSWLHDMFMEKFRASPDRALLFHASLVMDVRKALHRLRMHTLYATLNLQDNPSGYAATGNGRLGKTFPTNATQRLTACFIALQVCLLCISLSSSWPMIYAHEFSCPMTGMIIKRCHRRHPLERAGQIGYSECLMHILGDAPLA